MSTMLLMGRSPIDSRRSARSGPAASAWRALADWIRTRLARAAALSDWKTAMKTLKHHPKYRGRS